MKQTFKKQNSSFGLKLMLFLIFSVLLTFNSKAQEKVTGVVKDASGVTLPGVSVQQKGTSRGVETDFDGNYVLELTLGQKTLVLSYLGFDTQEISINGRSTINVVLKEGSEQLDEIVVVGYGTQKKESVVAAITQIKGADLLERAAGVTNVEQALQGNLPGVTAIQASGTPGESDMQIFIRGSSSWNGTGGPLIMVDGVKRSMNDIDMNDIENLSVLKDASATAVFGVEGANGVILITTKRGKVGKAQLSLNVNTTIKMVSQLPEKLDAYDALRQVNSSILRGLSVPGQGKWSNYTPLSVLDKYRNPNYELGEQFIYPNVNWEDELLKDFAQDYRVNLSVRGGNKTAKYFGSLAFLSERDIFDGNKYDNGRGYTGEYRYDRFNYRTNIDFNVTSTTELSVNLSGYLGVREKPSNIGNVANGIYQISPTLFYPKYPDGAYGDPGTVNIFQNSVLNLSDGGYQTYTNFQVNSDFILKQKLDFIAKGLSFKGRFSLDNNMRSLQTLSEDGNVIQKSYDPLTGEEILNIPEGVNGFDYVRDPWTQNASKVEEGQRDRRMVYDFSLNYNQTFAEKHDFTGLFLFRRQQSAKGSVFPTFREDWVGRVTYSYDSRYFLDVNGAYNGSEQFGSGYRFEFFPSVALGWTPSNEAFLEKADWLSKLKIRGSYGLVGDDSFVRQGGERWKYQSQWASGGAAYLTPTSYTGKSPYTFYRESVVGNPNLRWETSLQYNIGAEFSLFNGLLSGEIDYFAKDRSDIVVLGANRSVPDLFGQTAPDLNIGKVEVRGYEVVLASNYTFDNGVNLYGNFNFTQAKDLVIRRDDPLFGIKHLQDAGFRIGQSRTAIPGEIITNWDDVYSSTPRNSLQQQTRVGYYDLIDFNGDGVYNVEDNAPFGYAANPQRTWSATLGARYKGWNVSAQLYGTQNATRQIANNTFTKNSPLIFTNDLDYWTVDTPNNTDTQPAFGDGLLSPNPRDAWIDASLTRLKAVAVSYDVSRKMCEKLGLKKLTLFANGNNLFLWSNLPDDREFNSAGTRSTGDYPTLKRFNFGFNMNF
jgi:TonB-linked SusC/RagA family outer membrane protein